LPPSKAPATPDDVRRAVRRVEDFIMVAASRPKSDFENAVRLFAEAAGLSRSAHEELRKRIEALADDDKQASWAVIGVITGLFMADERAD
jgi:hypothetical protein